MNLGEIEEVESNSDTEDVQLTGPAVPNTLESTLTLFPLAESRNKKRNFSETAIDPETESSILFPSEDDLLGDCLNRVGLDVPAPEKRRKVGGLFSLSMKMKDIPASKGFKKHLITMGILPPEPGTRRRTYKAKKRPTSKVVELLTQHFGLPETPVALPAIVSVELPPQTMMPPNEFGVQLVAPLTLYDYQLSTLQWMIEREEGKVRLNTYHPNQGGGVLAMCMGLGKTPTAACLVARTLALQRNSRSCSLYVCPKNLLGTVRYQFEKFFGSSLKLIIYHRDFLRSTMDSFDAEEIRKYDVVITNYSTLVARVGTSSKAYVLKKVKTGGEETKMDVVKSVNAASDAFVLFPWFRIFLDESHEIRESTTQKFKSVMALESPRRFCLTGTPICNKVSDLFHQLEFTGFKLPRGTKKTKASLKSLNLMSMIKFVEYKDASSVKLPEKRIHTVYFDLSGQERFLHTFYMKTAQKVFREMEMENGRAKSKKTMEVHVGMIRVMQICSAPYLITPASKVVTEEVEEDVPATAFPSDNQIDKWIQNGNGEAGIHSSKMQKFGQLVSSIYDEAHEAKVPPKVIVFANYTSTIRLAIASIEQRNPDFHNHHFFVHGGTKTQVREESYTRFRLNPSVHFLFVTLKLGNMGLNLAEANKVIFLETWYSYAALSQGISRVHRIGQLRPVDIYFLLARDSIEERTHNTAMSKKQMAEDIAAVQDTKLNPLELKSILFQDAEMKEN